MTLFESIGFSLAILALAISVLSIMSQIKKTTKRHVQWLPQISRT